MTINIPCLKTPVVALALAALNAVGCNSTLDVAPLAARTASRPDTPIPPKIDCTAEPLDGGRTVVRYKIRNIGSTTIHIVDGRHMPYRIARNENTLVIFQGVNPPDPGTAYAITQIPLTRPLKSGEVVAGEVVLPTMTLRDHYGSYPTPASLLHGLIQVRCEVGWGITPITEQTQISMRGLIAWQHVTGIGPFPVILR